MGKSKVLCKHEVNSEAYADGSFPCYNCGRNVDTILSENNDTITELRKELTEAQSLAVECHADTLKLKSSNQALRSELEALREAVLALPVEEMVHQEPDGTAILLGYCMQAQDEWDTVRRLTQQQERESDV